MEMEWNRLQIFIGRHVNRLDIYPNLISLIGCKFKTASNLLSLGLTNRIYSHVDPTCS